MAKKTKGSAKKAPPKKPATKGKPATKAKAPKPARKAKAPKKRGEQQLELIKGVRYTELDSFCRQVGNHIDEINTGLRNKANALQSALTAMRKLGVTGYNYAGVTLTRTAGDEKITAKKDKGDGTTAGGALNQPSPPEESTGSGQDAGQIADALTEGNGDDDEPES